MTKESGFSKGLDGDHAIVQNCLMQMQGEEVRKKYK
jgi:hypothetical protein